MKKVEHKTMNGTVEYYENEAGNLTTAKPIEGIKFQRWVVTDDPSIYSLGKVFFEQATALKYIKHNKSNELYCIELSYISEELPPQYIHIVNLDGSKVRIL